jgi:transcriptional regulator with XRE-family HTH domain
MLDKSLQIGLKLDLKSMRVSQSAILNEELTQQAKHIGTCFARLRVARGVKQDVAAVRAGLSRNTAYRLESGDPGVAVGHLLRYLEVIAPGTTLQELLAQTDSSLLVLNIKEKTRRVRDLSSKEISELDF